MKLWHEEFPKEVLKNRVPSTLKDEDGMPIGVATWQAPTGRKYFFKEYKAPDWVKRTTGMSHNMSPTELKNYPVQGFSTGDIVPHMLGILYKAIKNHTYMNENCLLINTVHDSIMLDVKDGAVDNVVEFVTDILENTPKYISEHFDISMPFAKMGIGVSVGPNWYNMEEL